MAALCPGVHYGLSSQQNYGENRDLIFVKLTDSALRAIEEYLKNQNKFNNLKPTIKFLGNENGELSFPSLHHHTGHQFFNFAMSSTADMEGQGGSFECIGQQGPPRGPLEGLGSIPHKIRVHANDDVYEATRTRMTEAEDKYKNKCTREIKPTQTDIGRKVKVKQSGRAPLHPVHHHHHHQQQQHPSQHRKEMPSMRDSLLKQPQPSSYQPSSQANSKPILAPSHHSIVHSSTNAVANHNGSSNGLGSNHVGSTRSKLELGKKSSVPEVPRRPINRKPPPPQPALTPPGPGGHSDSSGSSGQSPGSTHAGSPPLVTSSKRPGFHEGPDGFAYKRQRIAHNTKPAEQAYHHQGQAGGQQGQFESGGQRRPVTDLRDASNMNPRSRESPIAVPSGYPFTNGYQPLSSNNHTNHNNHVNGGQLDDKRRPSSEDDDEDKKPPIAACPAWRPHQAPPVDGQPVDVVKTEPPEVRPEREAEERGRAQGGGRQGNGLGVVAGGRLANGRGRQGGGEREAERAGKYNKVSSSTDNRIARVSPDSQTDGMPVPEPDPLPYTGSDADFVEKENEFPDYRKQYVTIFDPDQRRKYKVDFNADYAEYRDLHSIVEKVSRKFALLEERLKQEDINSPRYKDIRRQIVSEYQESKKDAEHLRAKRRFQYLHDKLSHIKRLVTEYDQQMADGRY
ncbi:unnamed protein product [Phaedon cochleariae]|uniref:OCEL domain-containing protein n=1 Tax=Phaedon cochleariae TaxID=80249 RepID=A0A9N9SAK7_PHACE|nr:unnamed protein product [Phaedon cochleariae]